MILISILVEIEFLVELEILVLSYAKFNFFERPSENVLK